MAVTQPRKMLTKEEVIEILRTNARLFKDEPEFVTYIVDLAIYLLQRLLEQSVESKTPVPALFKASPKEIKDVYAVFERFASTKSAPRTCPICGSAVEGKRKCPNCDAMTF